MDELRNTENRRRQRSGKLRELFEEIQTMSMMNYSIEDMIKSLEERHPDEVYFAVQYLDVHKGEELDDIVKQAYEMLYSEELPLLSRKPEQKPELPVVSETDRKTMMERCTERLIRVFIRDRMELVIDRLANNKFKTRDFAELYDREYIETLVRTVKLFSPTKEVKKEMLQDRRRMRSIIDRIFEELYVLTKRERCWTCDWLEFENLKAYEGGEQNE